MPSVKLRLEKLEAFEEARNSLSSLSDAELQDRILELVRQLADYSEDEISAICSDLLEEHDSGFDTAELEKSLNAALIASERNEALVGQSL